jgi:hypothetical protein
MLFVPYPSHLIPTCLQVIICSLLFALLVYVHQHRMLLFSLLPKTAIRRMGGTTALFAEDKELGLMLQGRLP